MPAAIPFPHQLGGHCASSAMRDLFEHRGFAHAGVPLSEAMLFGLGAGLDAMLIADPTPKVPFYLGGRAPGFEESLLTRIGGNVIRRSEPDNDEAWHWVRAKLDRGEPAVMVADCQKLEYLKTRTSMPLHVIVATGYDDTHALIADNDRAEIQRCALGSLREARSARGFPLPAMNVTFEIAWPDVLPPIAACVLPAIAEVVRWMHEPSGPGVLLFGREAFGLRALERLESMAARWRHDAPPQPAVVAMLLWIAIEKGGTGGGFFRRLYRDFLAEALELVPSPELAAAHAHFAALAADWTALGAHCGAGRWNGVAERLQQLAQRERDGVGMLERVR